ncbi:MAG: hypothetical protein A3K19_13840 [Lentisphaerae bacterium RIFOXYB12_FULL_65_16]|nr:MAG: hypothetical protein A3K18_06435 [Lentisphaerae bacterium RIFOXYA12_64_32]OGV84239.1 MAG: hypothetical protein A3K19_13840 [Lentisphaerae bacterium RIFOXYB12_FULL_65_16]
MFRPIHMSGIPVWMLLAAEGPASAPPEGEPPAQPVAATEPRPRIVFRGVGGSSGAKQTMPDAPVTVSGKRHERKLATRRRQALLFLFAFAGCAIILGLISGTVAATQRLVHENQTFAGEIQTRAYRLQVKSQSAADAAPRKP